jgi:hypothetical protein
MRISRAVEAPNARAKMVSVIPVLYAKKPPPVNSWARVFCSVSRSHFCCGFCVDLCNVVEQDFHFWCA